MERWVQAAAHGVPTVATKNGGPVDIMATLHHGLLVDPTNSRQIGDALLKILTNPEVWDEMSHNGPPPPATHLPLPCSFCSSVVFAPGAWTKQAVFLHNSGSLIYSQTESWRPISDVWQETQYLALVVQKQLTWAVVVQVWPTSWHTPGSATARSTWRLWRWRSASSRPRRYTNHCFATPSPAVGMQDLQSLLPSKATCVRLRALQCWPAAEVPEPAEWQLGREHAEAGRAGGQPHDHRL